MKQLQIFVRKCKNGYYIRLYKGFWDMTAQQYIAKSKLEIGQIINDNWQEATEEETIKDQIV